MMPRMKFAVLYLCILAIVFNRSRGTQCPGECSNECSFNSEGNITEANCTGIRLQNLPRTALNLNIKGPVKPIDFPLGRMYSYHLFGMTNLQYLKIEHYGITKLEQNCFNALSALITLDLSNNVIVQIETSHFTGLSSLKYLHLHHNFIEIKDDAFRGMSSLIDVDLSHNNIDHLDNITLQGLTGVESLNLSFNKISAVDEAALTDLKKLTEIRLGYNTITTLPSVLFKGLANLRDIELQHNSILDIEGNTFGSLRLDGLNLMDNTIGAIAPSAFDESSIGEVHLENNNLKSLPESVLTIFSKSSSVFLFNNSWICNCTENWFRDIASLSNPKPKCAEPRNYTEMTLSDFFGKFTELCQPEAVTAHRTDTDSDTNKGAMIAGIICGIFMLALLIGLLLLLYKKKRQRVKPRDEQNTPSVHINTVNTVPT
ncbi:nyctalopin-like [Dreissena polymorpha]|uniref:Uncharacterized protein n=1 Tax=Dreissena polymorpha TaxID=45954 RepID=A0A9D4RG78_DREPO|nr:nyctalopin-like [Dreissena polymorpha]KAH3867134.1 hypothetical protein DPMN_030260 [Dreissena polymorpha]